MFSQLQRPKHHSLLARLLWFSLLMLAVVTLLIGLLVNYVVSEDNLNKAINQQSIWNDIAVRKIDEALIERVKRLEQLAQLLSDENGLKSGEEIQSILDSRLWLHGAFNSGLLVVDRTGRAIFDSPTLEGLVGLQLDDRAYFHVARDTRKPYISKPLIGRVTGNPFFVISAPIFDGAGAFEGIVTGNTRLREDTVLTSVSTLEVSEEDGIYVLDAEEGLIVASSDPSLVMASLDSVADIDVVRQAIAGTSDGRATSFAGEEVFFSASQLETTGWLVINTTPVESWLGASDALVRQIVFVSLVSLGVVGAITLVYLRRQLKPLKLAVEELDQIQIGEDSQTQALTVTSKDEVGQLVSAFNQVLDQLDQQKGLLLRAREQAEQANEAKSQFLSSMSHEIRTPLNAVITLAGIQLDHTDDSEGRVRLTKVQRAGEELMAMVEDIISFIELERGDIEASVQTFELEALCTELGHQFGGAASEKGLELLISVDPDVPAWVVGDKRHLTQVLSHLLSNAVKFTEEGSVVLRIGKESEEKNRTRLRFDVKDTGSGMTKEEAERLFAVFGQLDASHTRAAGGIGIGLALSQRLVQLMGGKGVELSTEAGKGSTFEFALTVEPALKGHNERKNAPTPIDGCSVLVVDDQAISREILRSMLEEWSIDVDEAQSGEQAIATVTATLERERRYDAILMDWEMPGIDGLSALRAIHDLYQAPDNTEKMPALLMVSAHDLNQIGFGDNDRYPFLHKPVTRSGLFDALNGLDYFRALSAASENAETSSDDLVLVVDDNKTNREVMGALLDSFGLKYRLAESGAEAITLLSEEAFDLVLMDIQMPDMDGYEATRQLLSIRPGTPVVALTAASLEKGRQEALDAGMVDFLTKPVNRGQFKQALGRFVTLRPISNEKSACPSPKELKHRPEVGPARILLVDDEPINLKVLAGGLSAEYRLQVANSGEKAIELARIEPQPDLILLDILMVGMDGYEVCRFLKADPHTRHIPIIFVSGLNQSYDEAKGLNLGAVDYIAKPFEMAVVKARIKKQLEAKEKNELLEKMSYLDALTHVANRRQLDAVLEKEIKRLQRNRGELGIIMLDIDYFKPYNDNYGHGQGDECLKQVAQRLQSVINRPGDLFARYGGEEFVALLPETGLEGTKKLAEAMRQAVEELAIPHEYSNVAPYVTISLGGIAKLLTRDDNKEILLKWADKALYRAKSRGRNQAVIDTK
ncbi:response regulator [Marinobacterium litorale]|uniref:response regulator n=1 Tax=Marinobacterium litorale TaxID=404770 RepID=UPI0004119CDD|nr:response regulator [Marinobacterium litorale]